MCLENKRLVKTAQISDTLHEDLRMFYILTEACVTQQYKKGTCGISVAILNIPLVSLHKVFKHSGSGDTCIEESNTVNVPLCYIGHTMCIVFNYIYLLILLKNRYLQQEVGTACRN